MVTLAEATKRYAKTRAKMPGLAGLLKNKAGADTTEAGEPDYAKMFNRWIKKQFGAKKVKPDTLGTEATSKGLLVGDDD